MHCKKQGTYSGHEITTRDASYGSTRHCRKTTGHRSAKKTIAELAASFGKMLCYINFRGDPINPEYLSGYALRKLSDAGAGPLDGDGSEISLYSADILNSLKKATGIQVGFISIGHVFLAPHEKMS